MKSEAKSLHILVVDDERDVCDVIETILAEAGHGVKCAFDAAQALTLFGQEGFDLVFLDIGLPDQSGVDVLEAMRKIQPRCKVVMITGLMDDEICDRSIYSSFAADGFITKPFGEVEIQEAITRVVRDRVAYFRTERDERRYVAVKARKLLEHTGLSLATVELVSGGALTDLLASQIGYGTVLRGGIVLHGRDSLTAALGVPEARLHDFSILSSQTCEEMARRARELFRADVGIGLLAAADQVPAEDLTQPLGTVIVSVVSEVRAVTTKKRFLADWPTLRREAVFFALSFLCLQLQAGSAPTPEPAPAEGEPEE